MSQTQVKEQGLALIGQKYDIAPDTVLSYAAEGRVPFGRYVSLGTDKNLQAKLPAVAGDVTDVKAGRGVALQQHSIENLQDGLAPGYMDKHPMSVMSKGHVFVETEAAVGPLSAVYVRAAVDGGNDQLGIFAGAAGTGLELLPNARYLKSSQLVDGKHVAVLELM